MSILVPAYSPMKRLAFLAYTLKKKRFNLSEFGVPFDREIVFRRFCYEGPYKDTNMIHTYTREPYRKFEFDPDLIKELDCIDLIVDQRYQYHTCLICNLTEYKEYSTKPNVHILMK